jgi:hypothetical protein
VEVSAKPVQWSLPPLDSVFCCITYPDRTGFTTMGSSLFDAAAKALEWVEVDRQVFGTARRFSDDQVLTIGVGMVLIATTRSE